MGERADHFRDARALLDKEQVDDALKLLEPYYAEKGSEMSGEEMEILAMLVSEKVTSSGFGDEKKAACNEAIDILECMKVIGEKVKEVINRRDVRWVQSYSDVVYEAFSKMNRCAREEERENAWCRLKEIYLEVLMAAKKVWKDKNHPERLQWSPCTMCRRSGMISESMQVYLRLAKLCKSYLDVADAETMKMCEEAAKEAKFMGKGGMEDEDWRDANKAIEDIKKNCADAMHEKELLDDCSS